MERRVMGKTGMEVSILGFGGAEIGFQGADVATVERLLGSALDAGLNVIDTAECYRESEELIGRAVGHRRHEFYLFTKCGHASGLDGPDWDPRTLEQSIDRSLRRLRTDYLDLVQLHSCSLSVLQRGDVIEVLEKAKASGKVRFIGYSGDREDALFAVRTGRFDTLQTSVNIADQEAIDLTIPEAMARGMGVIAKRPVANIAWRDKAEPPKQAYHHTYWVRLQKLAYPFLQHHPEEIVATALRFTLSVPGVHTAIVGTSKPDRWLQNAAIVEAGLLTKDDYEAIRQRWREVAEPDWVGQE
ncbi:hypothetical protein GCM10010885_16230 [Alicyclobacillus cellulosilyticus]|uniref:NADP-dependent oxidoreductase domain-containing protein n=1 Tax=Alicyclobacillus cellulosilyticus TaxID=1003997 RepID=A0A917KER7_9BACL|nr:aldo/keto reductase [Alicyclobacillus cellulosilyticus]GGJ07849.1 hypothetical protein GCM10010885_16230 [Alicyclobacillus cellulosilyticus]